jgi:hypothetical protein
MHLMKVQPCNAHRNNTTKMIIYIYVGSLKTQLMHPTYLRSPWVKAPRDSNLLATADANRRSPPRLVNSNLKNIYKNKKLGQTGVTSTTPVTTTISNQMWCVSIWAEKESQIIVSYISHQIVYVALLFQKKKSSYQIETLGRMI